MSRLPDLPSVADIIRAHDLRAQKSLGQNFLTDPGITARIASQAGNVTGARVIEVGPGPGGLTRALLETPAHRIDAVEFDPRAIAALDDLCRASGGRLTLHHADALAVDWAVFLKSDSHNVIVANLPYNIATPLLIGWLKIVRDHPGLIRTMVLMFQREVALRLVAAPGTADYGRLSVLCQWLCQPELVMTLPPGAFFPPPKVHSSVVRFVPKMPPPGAPSFAQMETVVARAFAHRRKMMRSYLMDWEDAFAACGIDPTRRAETLTVQDFIAVCDHLQGQV